MTVHLVGAGPGDPGLITRRGADLLSRADVVVYDRLVDPALLSLARPDALLLDVGKRPSGADGGPGGAVRQAEIDALLVAHGRAGRTVVRLKGGDPFLFGRGGEEAEALARAQVAFEVVPGVTSATAVPASAGIPVTHRGLSSSVTVVTGRVGEAGTGVDWASLAKAGGTLVVLMGVATRAEIARRLMEAGRPAETPAAVVEWGTTPAQRTVRTTLGALGAAEVVAPAVVVVGEVAGLDLGSLAARPLAGTTVVVTRARGQAGPLTAALADAGARVLELAVVALADPEDGGAALKKAARGAGGYDWVAFTSANAVHRLVPLLRDSRGFGPARLAAVGEATAQALAAYHLVADLVPVDGAGGAAALAAAFPDPPPGGRVLFPRAADARRALPEGLLARGWAVDEVVAYRTVAAPPPPAALCHELAGAQVVTFTSPSTVEGYLAQRDPAGRPLPVPPVVACIGPTTAEAARRAGLAVAVEPGSPSAAALAAALAARLGTAPPTAP